MRRSVQYQLKDSRDFAEKLLVWTQHTEPFCLLNSNGFTAQNQALGNLPEAPYELLAGAGAVAELSCPEGENAFDLLKKAVEEQPDWWIGYLTYDLKNHTEKLTSNHPDGLGFPLLHFFIPRYLFIVKNNQLTVQYLPELDSESAIAEMVAQIQHIDLPPMQAAGKVDIRSRLSREAYLDKVGQLKKHIQRGDIYEVNFCQEFYAEQAEVDPVSLYRALNEMSPAPFSAFYKEGGRFLLCASPERYLKKTGSRLYSQPIKGTAGRGKDRVEDEKLKTALLNDPKERSENVMIVDLVRNDLSRTAKRGSVKVEELFGVYTFPQVHQLISTISSEIREDIHFTEAIRHSFPMGSMTGAPKVRAMELIEEYEESRRGLFSGTVGYIDPEGNFDFNVVIRSILYSSERKYLSFMVGGAITMQAEAEKEYEECLLKAKAMMKVLGKEVAEKKQDDAGTVQ